MATNGAMNKWFHYPPLLGSASFLFDFGSSIFSFRISVRTRTEISGVTMAQCHEKLCHVVVLRLLLNGFTGFSAFHAALLAQV